MDTEQFRAEIESAVTPHIAAMRGIQGEIQTLHREIMARWESGDRPDSTSVVDLEAKMIELEAKVNARADDARLIAAEIKGQVEGKPRDPFAGVFLNDASEARNAYRTGGHEALHRALTSGTTLTSAGALNPDQESRFLDWLVQQQVALSRVNRRRMVANTAYLDELVTGTRKLRLGAEATDATPSDAITVARRTLATKETVWAEDLSYSFIEDNIERDDIETHIAQNLATAYGNDHNDLFWNGDEANSDAFLGINDGIIDIAKADAGVNDLDATSVTAWTTIFNSALRLMPFAFQARPDHAFFIPFKGVFHYADELSTRATSLGDAVILDGQASLRYFGIPVYGEPHLTADEAVLSPLQNLIWGIQRGITFESERAPRKRAIEYTISARTDQNYSKSTAVVLIDAIESSLRS